MKGGGGQNGGLLPHRNRANELIGLPVFHPLPLCSPSGKKAQRSGGSMKAVDEARRMLKKVKEGSMLLKDQVVSTSTDAVAKFKVREGGVLRYRPVDGRTPPLLLSPSPPLPVSPYPHIPPPLPPSCTFATMHHRRWRHFLRRGVSNRICTRLISPWASAVAQSGTRR